MVIFPVIALWIVIATAGVLWLRLIGQREKSFERFEFANQNATKQAAASTDAVDTNPTTEVLVADLRGGRRLSRNWIWLPWVIGSGVALSTWFIFRWPEQYIVAIGAVVSLLLSQLEGFLHTKHIAVLERQLADAIDIMVGAVSAGAGVGPAIDAATIETDRPLKLYLEEMSGRIRLGDDHYWSFDRLPTEFHWKHFSCFHLRLRFITKLVDDWHRHWRPLDERFEIELK